MSRVAVAHDPESKSQRRRQGLQLYLGAVEEAIERGVRDAIRLPGSDPEGVVVPLEPWAVDWIRNGARQPQEPPQLRELLLQCLAFLAKSANGIGRLRAEPLRAGTAFYSAQAELMLDSAVGMALLRETQTAVSALVAAGASSDAKALSKLQKRLRTTVQELKHSLAESNRGRDDQLVAHLTDEKVEQKAPAPTAVDPHELEQAATPVRRLRSAAVAKVRALPRRSRRTEVLLVLVTVACIVWVTVRAIPILTQRRMRDLSRNDFASSMPIESIVAPRPSAYIVVSQSTWDAYDDGQKRGLVSSLSGILANHDYWGLLLRTPGGETVARWSEEEGVWLANERGIESPQVARTEQFDRFVP